MYRIVLAVLVLLVGCQQETPPEAKALSETEISQIKKEVEASFAAVIKTTEDRSSDGQRYLDHLSSKRTDGLHLYGLDLITDKQMRQQLSQWDVSLNYGQEFFDMKTEVVVLSESVALVAAVMPEAHIYVKDDTTRTKSAWMMVFVKENDEWKIHSDSDARWPIENNTSDQ